MPATRRRTALSALVASALAVGSAGVVAAEVNSSIRADGWLVLTVDVGAVLDAVDRSTPARSPPTGQSASTRTRTTGWS